MSDTIKEKLPNLLTVKQFSAKHPAFSQGALRHLIFNEKTNGFQKATLRIGRRVYINEESFFDWALTQD